MRMSQGQAVNLPQSPKFNQLLISLSEYPIQSLVPVDRKKITKGAKESRIRSGRQLLLIFQLFPLLWEREGKLGEKWSPPCSAN